MMFPLAIMIISFDEDLCSNISLTSGLVMNQAYVSKYDETFDDETSDRKQGSDSHAQPEVPSIWRKNMHQEK